MPRGTRWAVLKGADGALTEHQQELLAQLEEYAQDTAKAWRIGDAEMDKRGIDIPGSQMEIDQFLELCKRVSQWQSQFETGKESFRDGQTS